MANLRDRVKAATATVGTGTITLGTAVAGYRTFASAYSVDRVVTYAIEDGAAWETGVGTYSVTNNTLTRAFDASSTGALLNLSGNAMASVAYLSRDNVADWPFLNVTGSGVNLAANGFNTISFSDAPVTDTHGGWANPLYTIPPGNGGVYEILFKHRFADGTAAGKSFSLAVHTSNADGPWSTWNSTTAASRQGALYSRQAAFNAGDQLRAFSYQDGFTAQISVLDLAISRIR